MTVDTTSILDSVFATQGRATRAIIDLDALAGNVRQIRMLVGLDTQFMAVVKADGYGHGAVMVARTALEAGASLLGVATVGEAAALRAGAISAPIVLLGPCDPSETGRALDLDIELAEGSGAQLRLISETAVRMDRIARVHLKFDTGMHRYGSAPDDATLLLEHLRTLQSVELVGLMTHLASADDPSDPTTASQRRMLVDLRRQIESIMNRPVAIHVANSAATLSGVATGDAIARVGIAMYGLAPSERIVFPRGVRPALSLVSRLARIHVAPPDSGVSYRHTYRTDHSERLGLVPIGYADGYRRGLSNSAWAGVSGYRCPVRGRVCMDQLVIGDVPDQAKVGDLVGLAGPIGGGPSIESLAAMTGTINYEIVAGISPRVPRYYVDKGRVTATLIEGKLETV